MTRGSLLEPEGKSQMALRRGTQHQLFSQRGHPTQTGELTGEIEDGGWEYS